VHTVACCAASGSLFVKWMQFALADGGPSIPVQDVSRSQGIVNDMPHWHTNDTIKAGRSQKSEMRKTSSFPKHTNLAAPQHNQQSHRDVASSRLLLIHCVLLGRHARL